MIHRISPAEAAEKMREGYTYVDVRTPEEFEEGHPKGAINVPIGSEDFAAAIRQHAGERIVLGCQTGVRSMQAARLLEKAGFAEIFEQRAGWDGARDPFGAVVEPGWKRAGLPIETGSGQGFLARK